MVSGEPKSFGFLTQRISVAIQNENATSYCTYIIVVITSLLLHYILIIIIIIIIIIIVLYNNIDIITMYK